MNGPPASTAGEIKNMGESGIQIADNAPTQGPFRNFNGLTKRTQVLTAKTPRKTINHIEL